MPRAGRFTTSVLVLGVVLSGPVATSGAGSATGATPPAGPVSHAPITAAQLLNGVRPHGLTANARFARPEVARHAPAFNATLRLAGATMRVHSDARDHRLTNPVSGKDTTFFPDARIRFFTVGTHLVPATQNVIRIGSLPGTRSYWDLIVQPGRVWTERGDHGWHRASFPFALVNSIEGETHTAIALFLYRGEQVSPVRYQVVQQTSPYDVPEYFTAWGTTDASLRPSTGGMAAARRTFVRSQALRWPQRPWTALRGHADRATLDGFRSFDDVVQSAVAIDHTVYRTRCPTAAGPFPYCSDVRYGVWSVTKSAMLNLAMMRLTQTLGPQILHARVARYLPGRQPAGWSDVRVGDLANMASGHGPGGNPTCYLCEYPRWYLARSEAAKTAQALDYPRFAKPGTQYNYRDQDAYLLGVVEDNLLKAKRGPRADVWTMLRTEVLRPIGIRYAPANSTIEPGHPRRPGHPLLAFGYYPTLDDLAKIAALYENGGAWHGHQILDRHLVERLLPRRQPSPAALSASPHGAHSYLTDWHVRRLRSADGCTRYLPQMEGWGGNTVTLAPGRTTLIRIRNNWVGDSTSPQAGINALVDALTPLCSG